MFRLILGVVIIITGLAGQYFFGHNNGDLISYQWLWAMISYLVIALGVLLMISSIRRNADKEVKEYWKEMNDLKANADHIQVNFSDCIIRNNDYIENVERHNSGLAATDMLAYKLFDGENRQQVAVNQSVVVYEHTFNGKRMKYNSFIIPQDKASLLLNLEAQGSTTIYIDRNDRTKYYFDMEFLHK